MSSPRPSPDLWAVVAPVCAAATIGLLGGVLGSLRGINPELRWAFDGVGVLGAVAGAWAGWWLGRGVWRLAQEGVEVGERRRLRRGVIRGFAVLGGATLLIFAGVAWGLPEHRRADMASGTALAILVLGGVAFLLRRLAALFEGSDDEGTGGTT